MKSLRLLAASAVCCFTSAVFAAPVNINTASASEIAQALNGIGENKAQAIVAYRQQYGEFKTASDILQVKGIGESTYEKNKADILIK